MRISALARTVFTGCLLSGLCAGQNTLTTSPGNYFNRSAVAAKEPVTVAGTPFRVWHDQKRIWTSPLHLKEHDLAWLLPLGATAGLLLATDSHSMERIHTNTASRSLSSNLSNGGLAVFAGASALSFGFGAVTHDSHARETGILTGEALADTFLVTEVLKFVSQRARPSVNGSQGLFWQSTSLNSSFPSEHASLAWSAATVIAQEYPGPVTQWAAYGLASVVSIARVTAQQHFPSDVLVGAAAGYLMGRYVYKTHHNPELSFLTPSRTKHEPLLSLLSASAKPTKPPIASVYVPLDSWIYPALRRLAEFGLVPDQASDLAPWTRAECLRQVHEASERLGRSATESFRSPVGDIAVRLVSDLRAELEPLSDSDNIIRLESVYTRFSDISGQPLRDSYHFGQTVSNDFGRPYERGFSNITGLSSYVVSGRLSAYVRGEYQWAPGKPADPPALSQFISGIDHTSIVGNGSIQAANRFQPLEMYVGAQLGAENITFGRESLWWGPGEGSAFSFSDNAQPFYMLRFAQTRPLILPGVFRYLGKIRTDVVFGKLSGHLFPARPYMTAQKISLDLTDNLEVGFTRSSFFGGVGHPLTFGALKETLFGINSVDVGAYGLRADLPGDRHSGFDFRWRVPGLRHYLTIYSDSYADDDPNPIDNPRRSAWSPGLYLSRLPKLSRMDFRFETYSTLLYAKDFGGNFLYWNNQYRDSYTNNGYLLGSWIGRDSRAYDAQSSYWASAKSKLTADYRQIKAGAGLLPRGGTQTDIAVTGTWGFRSEWQLTAKVQGERWDIPLLGSAHQDVLSSVGVVFSPGNWVWHR